MGPASAGLGSKRFSEKYGSEGRAASAWEATPDQQLPQPPAAPQLAAPASPSELQPGAAAAAATPVAGPGSSPGLAGRRQREEGGHTPREPAAALAGQPGQRSRLQSAAEPPGSARGQQAETPYSMGSARGAAASGEVVALAPAAGRPPEVAAAEGPLRGQQGKEAPGSGRRGRPSAPISALRRAQEQLTPRGSAVAPVPAAAPAAKEAAAERPPSGQQDEEAPASQPRARQSAVQRAREQLTPRGSPGAPMPATTPAAKEDRRAVGQSVAAAASGRASPSGSKGLPSLPLVSAALVREKPESAAAGMRQPGDAGSSASPAEARAAEAPQERELREATAAKPKRDDMSSSTASARRQAAENARAWQLPEARGAASQPGNAGSSTDGSLSAGPVSSAGLPSYKSTTAQALLAKLRGVQRPGIDPEERGEAAVHCLLLTERPAAAPGSGMQSLVCWCLLQVPISISPDLA